jgi:hypothetical protein
VLLLLADLIVLLHFAFVVFVVAGGLLTLRWPRAAWLHLPAAAGGAGVEFFGWICPLTPLENALRQASGAGAYGGDFVARYLLPILYPAGLTADVQLLLGIGVVAVNAAIYGWVLFRRKPGP